MKGIYILLGPPGSGKGTQGALLSESLNIPHISTGKILRESMENGSILGSRVKEVVEAGHLVSDDLMLDLLENRLGNNDCINGFILDGYPRNISQAESLNHLFKKMKIELSATVFFDISHETLISRLEARRGVEDRRDDDPEVQRDRLKIYKENTEPLVSYYEEEGKLVSVNSEGSIEQVRKKLTSSLGL